MAIDSLSPLICSRLSALELCPHCQSQKEPGQNVEFEYVMREGSRWAELKDLKGAEEIFLFSNYTEYFVAWNAMQRLDISQVAAHGIGEESELAKRVLSTTHLWVKETCQKLDGALTKIREAISAIKSRSKRTFRLVHEIDQSPRFTLLASPYWIELSVFMMLYSAEGPKKDYSRTNMSSTSYWQFRSLSKRGCRSWSESIVFSGRKFVRKHIRSTEQSTSRSYANS